MLVSRFQTVFGRKKLTKFCGKTRYIHFASMHREDDKTPRIIQNMTRPGAESERKTLKSGCLSLLTIRSFGARDGLGLSVRVWLGFGLGGSVRANDSLSDAA
eukprot:sb/3478420/